MKVMQYVQTVAVVVLCLCGVGYFTGYIGNHDGSASVDSYDLGRKMPRLLSSAVNKAGLAAADSIRGGAKDQKTVTDALWAAFDDEAGKTLDDLMAKAGTEYNPNEVGADRAEKFWRNFASGALKPR